MRRSTSRSAATARSGAGGFNGGGTAQGGAGGGGGATDIRTSPLSAGLSPDDRLLVAGGGGGAGVQGDQAAGAGGAAGTAGETVTPNEGGGAGTQENGGTAGNGHCANGTAGQLAQGGTGGYYTYSGGGGGGGYYGGGGGGAGCSAGGAGGGGGSSLLPTAATLTTAPNNTEPQIQISYTKPPNPTVVTGSATGATPSSATLGATVDPEGFEVTSCEFQYGTSLSYGSTVPCGSLPGSGTGAAQVSGTANELKANTPYFFRIVATNAEGTSYGSPVRFTTPPNVPTAITGPASPVALTSATLNATVDPEGRMVSACRFEYGTSSAYGSTAPCSPAPGAGSGPVAVSAQAALSANTTYHYRIVATSEAGTGYGAEETFSTRAQSVSFGFDGGEQEFLVPTGVFEVQVTAVGAHGASTGATGGAGALVNGELKVTPGETLYLEVGGNGTIGAGGFNGGGTAQGGAGGGGGATDIRTSPLSAGLSPDDRLLVAGGGGGAGVQGDQAAGAGGAAGTAGETVTPNEGGGAGTQENGGTAGNGHCANGTAGQLAQGGTGGYYTYSGGGGGGGYYGGGGGGAGCSAGGAGGGGGSSLLPTAATLTTAPENTEPQIQISYTKPVVSSVTPDAGLQAGGTHVTFTGAYLATVTQVRFGSTTVPASCSETECTAVAPPGSGNVHLTVSAVGANSAPEDANQFKYVAAGAAPAVTKLSVRKGPAAGGTAVTIAGSGFTGVTGVKFGSLAAVDVTVVSSTSITVVAPPSTAGTVDVTVTTPNGTSAVSSTDRFKFGGPTVTALSPNSGSKGGGTRVTVTGTGFAPGAGNTSFAFGHAIAIDVQCSSTTTCTMRTPAAKRAGTVDVRAAAGGTKSKKTPATDQFAYGA